VIYLVDVEIHALHSFSVLKFWLGDEKGMVKTPADILCFLVTSQPKGVAW